VLQNAFDRVCRKWRIESDPTAGKRLAEGVRSWGPHPDMVEPVARLRDDDVDRRCSSDEFLSRLRSLL